MPASHKSASTTLRHTAATLLLAAGEHPKVVQERLGHYSVAFTLDAYSHVLPSMQKAAPERIDAILAAASGEQ
jgi:integrase